MTDMYGPGPGPGPGVQIQQPQQPPPPYPGVVSDNADPMNDEGKDGFYCQFSDDTIRKGFIRKVYSILVCQLTVTMLFIALFMFVDSLREFSFRNPWLVMIAFLATVVCLIAMACCPDVRRSWPTNIIMLSIFTLCESFLLGTAASCYNKDEVLIAVGITAMIVLALTLFAMQTKWDFTMCSGGLLVVLVVLICFGFLCICIRNYYLHLIYSAVGALVFGMYIVFDTQVMLGGNHQYALSPEEYIFAALNLYLDIVNMFRYILRLVGFARFG